MSENRKPSILFVCLGNICRSPLAEGALRKAALDKGLEIVVDSAGTGDWHIGSPPDERAIAVAAENGVDIRGLAGRQAVPEDFHRFTMIVAMDDSNLRNLIAMRPSDGTAELVLALDCISGRQGESVADPYFGNAADFQETWRDVSAVADALIKRLT